MSFRLPKLPYSYKALEPHIDAKTMEFHHSKHHAGYVQKLNDAVKANKKFSSKSIEELLKDLNKLPAKLRYAVRNNGGGHFNHSLFWKILSPDGGGKPSGKLLEAIEMQFSTFDAFRDRLSSAAAGHFGSGWAWLTVKNNSLNIVTSANQDSPISKGTVPILGIDVWEHAYYLKYQNRRMDYIQAFWKVVNWKQVEKNLREPKR